MFKKKPNKVKKALHVDPNKEWTLCNEELGYQTQVQDVSQYIHHALDTGKGRKLIFVTNYHSYLHDFFDLEKSSRLTNSPLCR